MNMLCVTLQLLMLLIFQKWNKVFLESFGTVIVDEVHLVMARKTFRSLLYVTPRYLIALSATSYRSDGLDAYFLSSLEKKK